MTLLSCIYFWSMINGIDPNVTKAIISVESNGNPYAKGRSDDSGLMQIRARYVKETPLQLFNSCTNVMVGTNLLRKAKAKCKHSLDKTYVVCYNLGMTGAKRIRFPKSQSYYKKVIAKMDTK